MLNKIIFVLFKFTFAYQSELKFNMDYSISRISDNQDNLKYISDNFNWCDLNLCVISKNQHIPYYCGACWAFSTVSVLEDRLKIMRRGRSPDILLSIQHILNCINTDEASCKGGYLNSVYKWLINNKISYETSMPYLGCSKNIDSDYCSNLYSNLECKEINIARTCNPDECVGLYFYPNLTIETYYYVQGINQMKYEIFTKGPIACEIDAIPLITYRSGIIDVESKTPNHVVEVVGWGINYWVIRNSWGEYWGEFGFAKVKFGSLGLNIFNCIAPIIKSYTAPELENQFHCYETGYNCNYINKFV